MFAENKMPNEIMKRIMGDNRVYPPNIFTLTLLSKRTQFIKVLYRNEMCGEFVSRGLDREGVYSAFCEVAEVDVVGSRHLENGG